MKMHIKNTAKHIGKIGTVFTVAALSVSATPAQTPEEPDGIDPIGLWKLNRFDIVVAIEPDEKKDFVPRIHWIAENEREVYDYFGPPRRERPRNPSRDDILKLCGQEIKFEAEQDQNNPDRHRGRVHLPGQGFWANMTIHLKDADTADVTISKFIIRERDTWTRIATEDAHRYPRCAPPPKKP